MLASPLSTKESRNPTPGENVKAEVPPASARSLTSGRRSRRTSLYIVIIAVIVVAIVVVVAILPHLGNTGSSGSGGNLSYSAARVASDQFASTYQGGGWTLEAAGGLDLPSNWNANLTPLIAGRIPGPLPSTLGCVFTENPSWDLNSSLPSFAGSVSAGVAPFWEFLYHNATDAMVVAVRDGQASLFGTLIGPLAKCGLEEYAGLPDGVLDSTVAGQASIGQTDGFLHRYTGIAAVYDVVGGVGAAGPTWSVHYLTCQGQAEITSAINGSSGSYLPGYVLTQPVTTCRSGQTSVFNSLQLSFPPVVKLSNTTYLTTVQQASNGIAWSNLSCIVLNSTSGLWIASGWSVDAFAPDNSTIAVYSSNTLGWAGSATQAIATGDVLALVMSTPDYGGITLELFGLGSFAGSTGFILYP